MRRFTFAITAIILMFSLVACGVGSDLPTAEKIQPAGSGENGSAAATILNAALTRSDTSAFTDVPADAWYAEAVNWCRDNGIMSGTGGTVFSPDTTMSRAMLAAVLYRAKGSPVVTATADFPDVAQRVYYEEAAAWASENGIITGYDNGLFGADDPVTREQIAAILWRYAGSPEHERDAMGSFPDWRDISSYALDAALWTQEKGIITGMDGNRFNPKGSATRAQVATILFRYLNEAGKEDTPPDADNEPSDAPVVYFTSDISPEGLMAVYEALGWTPTGDVAVKLSTGEPPASNYLRPELIKDLLQLVDGTIVECNTAYGGSRASTTMHYQVAKDHGFTDIADFQILDEDGSMTLPVEGGSVLTENYVGKAFIDYDSYLILSHFKGHSMAGFGGAIKNISIGLGSSEGKAWIHSGGTSRTNAWGGKQDAFLEAMAEAGKSVADYLGNGEGIVYVNVMNRLSVDCDCDGHPAEPDIHDIGILASTDPVALDQACVDLIYAQKDGDGASLVNRIESRNGLHTLEHAEEIGLGSRTYTLVDIDS